MTKFDKWAWSIVGVIVLIGVASVVPSSWIFPKDKDGYSYSSTSAKADAESVQIQALEAQSAAQNRANAEAAATPAPAPEEAPSAFPHTFDSGFITVGCSKTLQDGGIAFLSVAYMNSNGDRRVVMVNERNLHGAILSPGAGDQYGMYPQDFPLVVRQVVEYASQHLSECDVIQG